MGFPLLSHSLQVYFFFFGNSVDYPSFFSFLGWKQWTFGFFYILPRSMIFNFSQYTLFYKFGFNSYKPLFFFAKVLKTILGLVPFHIKCRICLSLSTKSHAKIWIGIAIDLQSQCGDLISLLCWVFKSESSNPWTRYVSLFLWVFFHFLNQNFVIFFPHTDPMHALPGLYLSVAIVFEWFLNGIIFLSLVSARSVSASRNAIRFLVLRLDSVAVVNSLLLILEGCFRK